jgi:hypothetical protein
MKISEIRDEKAVEVLGDLMEPFMRILKSKEVQKCAKKNISIELAQAMVKADPKAVLEILAICNQVPLEEYHPNPFEVIRDLAGVLMDEAVMSLFFSAPPKAVPIASGDATDDTTEGGQENDS